jgi:hypothetical protein
VGEGVLAGGGAEEVKLDEGGDGGAEVVGEVGASFEVSRFVCDGAKFRSFEVSKFLIRCWTTWGISRQRGEVSS